MTSDDEGENFILRLTSRLSFNVNEGPKTMVGGNLVFATTLVGRNASSDYGLRADPIAD